jgi:hypothetical protein
MIALIISTFVIFLLSTPFISYDQLIISYGKSFLIGVLYDKAYIEDEEVYENTAQYSFVFVLITLIWYTDN